MILLVPYHLYLLRVRGHIAFPLCVCLCVCVCVFVSVCVCLSVSVFVSVCKCLCLFVCEFLLLSVCLSLFGYRLETSELICLMYFTSTEFCSENLFSTSVELDLQNVRQSDKTYHDFWFVGFILNLCI